MPVINRVFGARTSFMEVLARVLCKAYWFFVFIILTMVSVALSFAVLYKDDAVCLFSLFSMRFYASIFRMVARKLLTISAMSFVLL